MPRIKLYLALAPFWALLLITTQVSATDFCIIRQSADGYVALRGTPSTDGALLVRAKAGEAVIIQKTVNGEQIVSSRWLRVMHFPDTIAPPKTDPSYKRGRIGWMHKSYVRDCG